MEKIKISKHILSARTHHFNPIAIKKMRPQALRAAVLEPPLNLDYARFDEGDYARFDEGVNWN
jgi:hypothetical protein